MKSRRITAILTVLMLILTNVPVSLYAQETGIYSSEINSTETEFKELAQENDIYALFYLGKSYDLKAEPGQDSQTVVTITRGSQLTIREMKVEQDGIWYGVDVLVGGNEYYGFINEKYIVSDNNVFNEWISKNMNRYYSQGIEDFDAYIRSNFPSSYWEGLTKLHNAHPNWVFVAFDTGLDFDKVVDNEMYPTRNLIYITAKDEWKSKAEGDYDASTGKYIGKSGPNWVQASREAVEYFMNPVNFLDETRVFMFEQLTYNGDVHNQAGVEAVLSSTWMSYKGLEDQTDKLYSQAFMEIGKTVNVSPFHLASRVRQEQGNYGTSALISGTYPGYEGYYNYYNVSASGSTETAIITSGLKYAQSAGWNTRYASILGGAKVISKNYIARGQDSVYLQKFDVDNSDGTMYSHQYMQNVQAPYSESSSVMRAYKNAGALENRFVFKIPVYNEEEYIGNINSELISFTFNTNVSGATYISGEIVVVEWVNGVSTVPPTTPTMRFVSSDGTENIDVFVTPTGTNTYYFDRFISGLTPGKDYRFEITLTSPNNIGSNKTMNVLLSNSWRVPSSALLGLTDSQRLYYKTADNGELSVYSKNLEYTGNINSELKNIELVKGPNGNYVSGSIVVVEWVDGLSTVPEYTPVMVFKSTDGLEELPVFVTPTGTNTYYFDRSIGILDSTKEYILTVESGDAYNISSYKKMTVNTFASETKEGYLWETDTQVVYFKTDAATGDLRIYAVDK